MAATESLAGICKEKVEFMEAESFVAVDGRRPPLKRRSRRRNESFATAIRDLRGVLRMAVIMFGGQKRT
jgi:hypothetical protein